MRLSLRAVKVELHGRIIIKNASLELGEGEAAVIAGPSGSGKTTLLRAISGSITSIFGGRVEGAILPELPGRKRFLSYLPQEPWFGIATPYVWSEITTFSNLNKMKEVETHLRRFGLHKLIRRTTYTLSAGETQRLGIASAEASGKEIYLLDEPTSHLDPQNALKVKNAVKSLIQEGKIALIVDHDPTFWEDISRNAYAVVNGELRDFTPEIYKCPKNRLRDLRPPDPKGGEVLHVSISGYRHPGSTQVVLKDVCFSVEKGSVVTVIGPSGVGKSTLLKAIISALTYGRQYVKASGKVLYIPDNPLLYFTAPNLLKEVGRKGMIYLRKFGLEKVALTPVGRLSSGERRRGAIASALSKGASLTLMDEPTIGLDPQNKVEVLETIKEAADSGTGFLIATHDRDVLRISKEVMKFEAR